jgi:hypothetical protein
MTKKAQEDYIIRHYENAKEKRTVVQILQLNSKVIAEIWLDTREIKCTESTLLEVMELVADKLTGRKNRQRSFLINEDLPKIPRSQQK